MPECTIKLQEPTVKHFVNYCLLGGSRIRGMELKEKDPMWPGMCNPSIMWDEKTGKFIHILRNVNYILHGSQDTVTCPCGWGPVFYSIPCEDGRNLRTRNWICTTQDPMIDDMEYQLIDTRPYTPKWEFQGQEDARIVRWDDILYTTGVRRDDNKDGRGRMELMSLSEKNHSEIRRTKISALGDDNQYCEKNWMPIMDMPYHYVQLSNPTIIVRTDPKTGRTTEVLRRNHVIGLPDMDYDIFRGSSQVIPWNGKHIAIVHTCELWMTAAQRKYARYCHCFIMWDEDWNIEKVSPLFSFNDYNVEFTCGMAYHNGMFYIPFAIEDNFSFLMEVPEEVLIKFIDNDTSVQYADTIPHTPIHCGITSSMFSINVPSDILYGIGVSYFNNKHFAAAYNIFVRGAELGSSTYKERFMAARSVADAGHRNSHEIGMWILAIEYDPSRPEAYMGAAMYYLCRNQHTTAAYFARKSKELLDKMDPNTPLVYYSRNGLEQLYYKCIMETSEYSEAVKYYTANGMECGKDRRIL